MSFTRIVRRPRLLAGMALLTMVGLAGLLALDPGPVAASGARSTGYYYGTDSYGPAAAGTRAPYVERRSGALYSSYVGELGTWTNWLGCTHGYALDQRALRQVNADEAYGPIPGVAFYWFAAGPGADPRYDRTYAEAYRWGVAQAQRAAADYEQLARRGLVTETTYIPLLFMDIEGQPRSGYGNGWNERVNRCGVITRARSIPSRLDRATFNGFTDYVHTSTIFHPGVYSTPSYWTQTFGTGAASRIPNTYEWTPVSSSAEGGRGPVAFTAQGRTAQWFGGVRDDRKAGWQWTRSGGDFDQWNAANLP